jgi:hypothetical protein
LALRFGGCRINLYESYDLSSSQALYLSDAKQLQLWLHDQESDFTVFDETPDFEAASKIIKAAKGWR